MAFTAKHLALVGPDGNSDAPRIWTYKTDDAHTVVDGAGYFNAAADLLRVGDIIYVVVVTNLDASNEATSTYGPHLVNANSGGVVDVTNVTTGTVTDSD